VYPSPTAPHARRHRQRSRRTPMGSPLRHRVLVIAAAAVAAVLTGGPAQAHSDLESATPAVDSTVTQLPDTLELTFSDGVQPGFAQIAVLDAAGADVVTADPTVDGDVVSQPVAMTAAGDYGVSYRIVSADGQPPRVPHRPAGSRERTPSRRWRPQLLRTTAGSPVAWWPGSSR
jgi:methionine-rich copper-binding protein CopC